MISDSQTRPSLQPPSPPPILPVELLKLIIFHLQPDHSTAVALSLLSKQIKEIAKPYLWRHVDLFAPSQLKAANDARERVPPGDVLKKKLRKAMNVANTGKWARVKEATLVPTPGALHSTIQILDNIAPTLESLIVLADRSSPRPIPHIHTLDIQLITCDVKISFTALTHLWLDQNTIQYFHVVILLCEMAPNLTFLDIAFEDSRPSQTHTASIEELVSQLPLGFTHDTKIRHLNLGYNESPYAPYEGDPSSVILGLLRHSPQLTRVAISCEYLPLDLVYEALGELRDLVDLYWPSPELGDPDGVNDRLSFPSLKRLGLQAGNKLFATGPCATLPVLEVVDFDLSHDHYRPAELDPRAVERYTISSLASWIRRHPLLHTISISHSSIEGMDYYPRRCVSGHKRSNGSQTGILQSLTHRGAEVIRVSLLFLPLRQQELESGDTEIDRLVLEVPGHPLQISDNAVRSGPSVWRTFTDFDGGAVPDDVWEGMRRVEGASEEDWDARGVEVSAEAWEVLMVWRRTSMSEEEVAKADEEEEQAAAEEEEESSGSEGAEGGGGDAGGSDRASDMSDGDLEEESDG